MKRFLSMMLAAAMLMSVFCFNVSAAVSTKTGGEWSVLISDDFDGDKATYFTGLAGSQDTITYPFESEGSTNKVVDLQIADTAIDATYTSGETTTSVTAYYDGASIGAGTYTTAFMGGTTANPITMPNSTVMIEFDMCGKTLTSPLHVGLRVNSGSAQAVKINPNNIEADTWYTFRIVVERAADKDTFTVDNTTVYRKLRDGNDDFVKVEGETTAAWSNTTTLDYGIGASSCGTKMIAFGVTAHNSYIRPFLGETTENSKTQTKTYGISTYNSTTAHINYVAAMKDAHYQIDNVTVYAKSAETTPELSNGILRYWDMEDESEIVTNCDSIKVEDTTGDGTLDPATYAVNSVMLEDSTEDNHYVKFAPGVAPFASTTDYMVSWVKGDSTFTLPETFILSFDANNAALGTGIDFVIRGDGEVKAKESGSGTDPYFPRGTLYLRSHSGILNKWYSYKVVCKGTPYAIGAYTFTVYRRERGSDGAWTELSGASFAGKDISETGTMDYGWASTMSGAEQWINSIQIGSDRRGLLDAYTTVDANSSNNPADATEDQTNHENGVWYIDNVMITEAAAITGDVSVADSKVTAALNLSTTAASTPILAVYDGTKLVDVDFSPVAHEGAATLTADYADTLTAPKAMLYVWDSLANGKPVLAEAIDVATYID